MGTMRADTNLTLGQGFATGMDFKLPFFEVRGEVVACEKTPSLPLL